MLFVLGLLILYATAIVILIVTITRRSRSEDELMDHMRDIEDEFEFSRRRSTLFQSSVALEYLHNYVGSIRKKSTGSFIRKGSSLKRKDYFSNGWKSGQRRWSERQQSLMHEKIEEESVSDGSAYDVELIALGSSRRMTLEGKTDIYINDRISVARQTPSVDTTKPSRFDWHEHNTDNTDYTESKSDNQQPKSLNDDTPDTTASPATYFEQNLAKKRCGLVKQASFEIDDQPEFAETFVQCHQSGLEISERENSKSASDY